MSNLVRAVPAVEALAKGGIGASSRFMQVKPDRILLVQPTSKEGTPGKLRIVSTGEEFDSMKLVALFEPLDQRNYYEGEGFSSDNLMCFSRDNITPDSRAKVPQAEFCRMCSKSDWSRYRETNRREDIPSCKQFIHNLVVERQTKLPYYLDVYGTSRRPFESGLQVIARNMALLRSQGKNPNIFDFSFTLSGKKVPGYAYYVLEIRDVRVMDDEVKKEFGELYLKMAETLQSKSPEAEKEPEEKEFADGAEEVAI